MCLNPRVVAECRGSAVSVLMARRGRSVVASVCRVPPQREEKGGVHNVHTLGFGFVYTGVGLGRILEGVLWHDRRAFVCCCGRIGGWTPAYPDAAGDEYDMRI
jgi:hypothetical protein